MAVLRLVYHESDQEWAAQIAQRLEDGGFTLEPFTVDSPQQPMNTTWQRSAHNAPMVLVQTPAARQSLQLSRMLLVAISTGLAIFPVLVAGEPWTRFGSLPSWDFRAGLPDALPRDLLAALTREAQSTRIFVSYSRQDKEFVYRLAADLDRLGAQIWLDVEAIPPGVNWKTEVQRGLETCETMILVLSPDSMTSPNVRDEWQYFYSRDKLIIPVLHRPTLLPTELKSLNYVNFHAQQHYDIALDTLCRGLRAHGLRLFLPEP